MNRSLEQFIRDRIVLRSLPSYYEGKPAPQFFEVEILDRVIKDWLEDEEYRARRKRPQIIYAYPLH